MEYQRLFLACVLAAATLVNLTQAMQNDDDDSMDGNQKYLSFGNVKVQVAGRSGKIKLWRNLGDGNITSPPIMILMDELLEVDASGQPVGKGGQEKHSFKSFASQDFTFSAPSEEVIPNSNVTANYIEFNSQLTGLTSTLVVKLYVAKENGTIVIDGESSEVIAGQTKFTIELSNWKWCGCQQGQTVQTGEFIDFVITISVRDGSRIKKKSGSGANNPDSFDLGFGAGMALSKKVQVDGTWRDMAANYPMWETRGNKVSFTFRFDRFNSIVFYDPTVDAGSTGGDEPAGGATGLMTSLATLLTALLLSTKLVY